MTDGWPENRVFSRQRYSRAPKRRIKGALHLVPFIVQVPSLEGRRKPGQGDNRVNKSCREVADEQIAMGRRCCGVTARGRLRERPGARWGFRPGVRKCGGVPNRRG